MPVSTVACAIAGDVDGAHRCTPSVTQRGRSLDQGGESVDIRAASKNYDAVRALDNVTLNVAPREFVSLLGPSGSGKTTLLGILGGFIQPSSGSIHFGDRDVTFLPPHKRDIGVVFQNYALFPHMSVGENVAFPLRARRIAKADWARRYAAALAMVGLAGYETRGIAQLSGGQRQRVALARAMIFEPRLILMDEPLSALDKQLREAMQIELRELHKRIGATIIYVTHDQREALTMSDRVAILKDGRLVQIDRPERLHDYPADSFVASFIGEASLLPVPHRRLQRGARAGRPEKRARDSGRRGADARGAQREAPDRGRRGGCRANRLTGKVTDIVYQGESLRVFLQLADGTCLSLRQPSHYQASRLLPPVGGELTVTLHPEDTIVVPKAQEKSAGMNAVVKPECNTRPTKQEMKMSYDSFKVLTFDVVGTLIDFETGVLDAVRKISGRKAAELSDDQIFASYKRGRDAHPERSSEVMFHVYRYLAKELGLPADDAACNSFQLAVLRWQPFSDSVEALKRLRTRFRLVAMTNADRVALSCYAHALDNPFHDTICADDTGVAKPNPEFFAYNKGRQSAFGYKQSEILHVAQSQHHDIGIARKLGYEVCWIERRQGMKGFGGTPEVPELTKPDFHFATMKAFADAAVGS